MMNKEEQFEEIILASEGGTVLVKTNDNNEVYLGLNKGHDVESPPPVWAKLTPRQITMMVDMLKEYCVELTDVPTVV